MSRFAHAAALSLRRHVRQTVVATAVDKFREAQCGVMNLVKAIFVSDSSIDLACSATL